jgi:hypothetical protein
MIAYFEMSLLFHRYRNRLTWHDVVLRALMVIAVQSVVLQDSQYLNTASTSISILSVNAINVHTSGRGVLASFSSAAHA